MINKLTSVINNNEEILWQGRPNKKCFIFESIFNKMLPFAILWLIIDVTVMLIIFSQNNNKFGSLFFLLFFLIHLMPVWIYLSGVLFSFLRYKNTYYVITDAGIYVSGGLFTYSYSFKPFTQLFNVVMRRGIFDQHLGVGDVICQFSSNSLSIINISEYEEIYKMVTKLQRDVYSDTQFPNQYRPNNNPGYNTKITPFNNEDKSNRN